MDAIVVLLLIFFGVGILIYVVQAWQSGEVRMGSNGLKPYTPSKDREPLVFYFGILLYIGLGCFFPDLCFYDNFWFCRISSSELNVL